MLELDRLNTQDQLPRTDRAAHRRSAFLNRFNPTDRLTLAYLTFTMLLLIGTPQPVVGRTRMLVVHAVLFGVIALLVYCRAAPGAGLGRQVLRFLGHWYPVGLPGYFFEEIHSLVHVVFPGWFDGWLIPLDYATFGAHPTVWLETVSGYWLTELMNFAYFAYWPLLPGLATLLWLRGRGTRDDFASFTLALCLAYYACYLVFIFFPVEGPYHTLASLQQVRELHGGFFTAAVALVEKHGRIHGGAFPSAHVAGSVVALIAAFRWSRRLGYALMPLVLLILASTVYGRYHYAADVWAGTLIAILSYPLAVRLSARQPVAPTQADR